MANSAGAARSGGRARAPRAPRLVRARTPNAEKRSAADEAAARARAEHLSSLPFQETSAKGLGFFRGLVAVVSELAGQRELLGLLVRRELKAKYKDSSLGFIWTLIKPLTMLLIYFVAIGQFLGAARSVPDFAIFVYAGLTLWTFYNEIVVAGTSSIITNAGLIRKIYLPREIFPLAAAGSALVNFGIQFGILTVAVIVSGQFPLSWNLLYVPAGVLLAFVYALALAVLLSALNVYLRDIQYLVEVGMQVLFWASPIVYAWANVFNAAKTHGAWLAEIYLANPITIAVLAFQRGMWKAGSQVTHLNGHAIQPQPWPQHMELRMLIAFAIGLILLAIAQRIFTRLQGNFAQEI